MANMAHEESLTFSVRMDIEEEKGGRHPTDEKGKITFETYIGTYV